VEQFVQSSQAFDWTTNSAAPLHDNQFNMEYEKCYVFQPESTRPAKKHKTEEHGLHASWRLRKKAYEDAWQSQQSRIDVGTCK
jgi:hypothetical protein